MSTEVEPERWPDTIRAFVDRLGTEHSGLTIAVEYSEPVWTVTAGCTACGTHVTWGLLAAPPRELVALTPIPSWLYKLADLPPGDK